MASELETARRQIANGQHKKAINTLWVAESYARADATAARALADLVSEAREQTTGRVRRQYDMLFQQVQATVASADMAARRLATSPQRDAIAVVPRCRVLGGHGLPATTGELWELVFTPESLRLVDPVHNETLVPYSDVTAVEIGGPGARKAGGGFIGGGFGLQGAAEGMLIASALNMLTTRTTINTVICIQTTTAELFLHQSELTPDALRMRLSRVFTILRQRTESTSVVPGNAGEEHAVERLTKLAALLDRGLITDEEFQKLKADILG